MKKRMKNKCKTKYPLLLVHGVGIRGEAYWGRTPACLRRHGAIVLCSRQDAMGSLQSNVCQLRQQAKAYLRATGAKKINLLAHSKGGLEARILACTIWGKKHIASVTTISSPHRGIHALDLLANAPAGVLLPMCAAADALYAFWGDQKPDASTVIGQLGTVYAAKLNSGLVPSDLLVCQSYASYMCQGKDDCLLALPHRLLCKTDGVNDGLVPAASMCWGNHRGSIPGHSHLDTMDLWRLRKNTPLLAWYVSIVADLKRKGL